MYVFFICDKIGCGKTSYRMIEDSVMPNDDTCDHCNKSIHEPVYQPHINPSIKKESND